MLQREPRTKMPIGICSVHSRQLQAVVALLALACCNVLAATHGRSLWTGDILGTIYTPPPPPADFMGSSLNVTERSRVQDHAHFYSAAEVLTRLAESTFALSAQAHAALMKQPGGPTGSACVHDGSQCLFNPMNLGSSSFPAPEFPPEKVLKRFALEAMACRTSLDRATCHLDANCDWDGITGACFLAHDPHPDFTESIAPCQDMLYSRAVAACWRRRPDPSSNLPCGDYSCKLYSRGAVSAGGPGALGGLSEDRCMPDLASLAAGVTAGVTDPSGSAAAAAAGTSPAASMRPEDLYDLLKRFYGPAMESAPGEAAAAEGMAGGAGVVVKEGFGSCHSAALHHAFATSCRNVEREACLADQRCSWMSGIVKGQHCVLSREAVLELLMGGSAFTKAVLEVERTCLASSASPEACVSQSLVFRTDQPQH